MFRRAEAAEKRLGKYRGKYCIYWREDGEAKRISLRTDDHDIAQQRFRDTLKLGEKPKDTIEDYFNAYLKDKPQEEKTWKALTHFWSNYRPYEITKETCREYIKYRDVKNGTIHRELTILRAAIRYTDPHTKALFHFPKKPPPKEHFLTKMEFKKLFDATNTPHLKLFLVLAVTTAGRHSAIVELTWNRVDFKKGQIRLSTGKEGVTKGRATVPINEQAYEFLEEAYKARLTDHVIEYGGKPIKSIRKSLERTAKKVGLKVTPHVLRHSAAVWMAEDNVPMVEIAQFLGHSSINITYKVYARFSPEHLKNASKALNVFN